MEFWFLIAGAAVSFAGMTFHGVVGQKSLWGMFIKATWSR